MVEWISDKYAMRKSQITAGREEVITQKKYIEFNYNAAVFHSIMLIKFLLFSLTILEKSLNS